MSGLSWVLAVEREREGHRKTSYIQRVMMNYRASIITIVNSLTLAICLLDRATTKTTISIATATTAPDITSKRTRAKNGRYTKRVIMRLTITCCLPFTFCSPVNLFTAFYPSPSISLSLHSIVQPQFTWGGQIKKIPEPIILCKLLSLPH